jgi:hypothetical protein
MSIYRDFVRNLFLYYFVSSLISVVGVGGVLIATTLEVNPSDLSHLVGILFISFICMAMIEYSFYQNHINPIKRVFKMKKPSLDDLTLAYKQTHRFPMLTGIRILGPHLFGLSIPALLLTCIAIYLERLSLTYEYVFYGLICAILIATMHAMIEYFKTASAIEPVLAELQSMAKSLYQTELSSWFG